MNKGLEKNKSVNIFVAWIVALALFSVCLGAGMIVTFNEHKKMRVKLDNVYNNYAYTLYDSLNNLETDLAKLMVSPSKAQNICIVSDSYRQAEVAISALTSLPISIDSEDTAKFLNQVGDFCKSYCNAMSYSRDYQKFTSQIESLYIGVRELNARVSEFMERINKGERIANMKPANKSEIGGEEMQHNSVEYPELIYDGPFSDGSLHKHFKALENKDEISLEDAQKILTESGIFSGSPEYVGMSESDEPCYELASKDGNSYASVTKRGGLIINFSANKDIAKATLTQDGAIQAAEDWAAKLGYSVKSVWYTSIDGIATVNLAPIINGVIYYPDLVKVKVALDNGGILGLEASGYCRNNCARKVKPTINEKTANSLVSNKLNLSVTRLAVIPDGEREVLCYEVAGEYKGLEYFIYLDAYNGEQIKILRVIDSNQGKLTI